MEVSREEETYTCGKDDLFGRLVVGIGVRIHSIRLVWNPRSYLYEWGFLLIGM